jgi:spermidine/putrescine-binding protein
LTEYQKAFKKQNRGETMKRITKAKAAMLALCMAIGAGATACDSGAGNAADSALAGTTLNFYTWEGVIPDEVIAGFEEQYGVTVNYNVFDTDETMYTKLEQAKGGDYDFVIADDYIIETVIQNGLAQKLDTSKLSNYGNIDSRYQSQFYDPNNEYTIPHGAGVQTIVYDPALVDVDITGYADLWDASLADKVGIIGNYRVINGMALKVLGKSYNTDSLEDINAAGDKLKALAPNIRLIKDDGLQEDIVAGEVAAAVMYTSQATLAMMSRPDLQVVFPSEGIGFGIMAGFIPSNAPNADAAYAFIDYILDAQNGAKCFEFLQYYSTNSAANEFISEEFKPFLTLPEEFSGDMEMIQNVTPEANSQHELIWTEFKTAAGQS